MNRVLVFAGMTAGVIMVSTMTAQCQSMSFARPVRGSYTPCLVKPVYDLPVFEGPKFDSTCIKDERDADFLRGPMIKAKSKDAQLSAWRNPVNIEKLVAASKASSSSLAQSKTLVISKSAKAAPLKVDASGFVVDAQQAAPDCCGGPARSAHKTVKTTLK